MTTYLGSIRGRTSPAAGRRAQRPHRAQREGAFRPALTAALELAVLVVFVIALTPPSAMSVAVLGSYVIGRALLSLAAR